MRTSERTCLRIAVACAVLVFATGMAAPVLAATAPVDVSGPVDGLGPGLVITPGDVPSGNSVGLVGENLPTAAEAASWVDDADFSDETGTYSGPATVALCGNATAASVPIAPVDFDPALHCDGGDARSASFLQPATAVNGALMVSVAPRTGLGTFEWDDDDDPGTDPIDSSMGIGTAEATCAPAVPADVLAGTVLPCRYLVQDGDGPVGAVFSGSAGFLFDDGPGLELTSISGQLPGAAAARGGDELIVSGTGWDPGAGLAAAMCDPSDELVCDPSSSTAGLSIDGSGALSGTVPVSPLNTPGFRLLWIAQTVDDERAVVPVRILGDRTVTSDPVGGGPNTAVNLTGSDFDPLQPVTITGSDGVNPTSDVGAGVVDANGDLTGSIIITSPATVSIVVTEDDAPATEGASTPFSFTTQVLTGEITINSGALTLEQTGGIVQMSPITLTGEPQSSTGSIQTVSVTDARGTLSGWSVTAVVSDWVDITDPDPSNPIPSHVIPAGNLSWTPSCQPAPGSGLDPSEAIVGPPAPLDPVVAATMCSAGPGGGAGLWITGATLSLDIPASVVAATYRATLTIIAT